MLAKDMTATTLSGAGSAEMLNLPGIALAFGLKAFDFKGMRCVVFWFFLPAIALSLATGSGGDGKSSGRVFLQVQATTQLPRNVRPTHYDVAIVPHAVVAEFRRYG